MKRSPVLILATALLLPGQSGSAQTTLALHGGINVSILDDVVEDSILPITYTRIAQPTFGLSATFALTPPEGVGLGVQLSASYVPKGADLAGRSASNVRLKYLELAALLDVRVPLIVDPLALHVLLGPAAGWLLSCEREAPCADDEFNSLDIGLSFGGRLAVTSAGGVGVMAGLLYNAGLTHADALDPPLLKNRSVALEGGILFPIG